MIARAFPDKKNECQNLWKEAQELTLIFSKIVTTSKNKKV